MSALNLSPISSASLNPVGSMMCTLPAAAVWIGRITASDGSSSRASRRRSPGSSRTRRSDAALGDVRGGGSPRSASSSSSSGSTRPSQTRLFLNDPAMHLTSPSHDHPTSRAATVRSPTPAPYPTGAGAERRVTPRRAGTQRTRLQRPCPARAPANHGFGPGMTDSRLIDPVSAPSPPFAVRTRAEHGRADPDHGGALLDRHLEVVGHAHGQLAEPEVAGERGGTAEQRPRGRRVGRLGGHHHQPGHLEAFHRAGGPHEPVEVGRAHPVGRRPLVELDLHKGAGHRPGGVRAAAEGDRKSTRLNSSHVRISYAVLCLKKKYFCKRKRTSRYISNNTVYRKKKRKGC